MSTPSKTNSRPNPLIPHKIKNPKTRRSETIQFGKIELEGKKRAAQAALSRSRTRHSSKTWQPRLKPFKTGNLKGAIN
jgi:hypothetical protein